MLVLVIGGSMGYISAVQIKNEPVLCSLGYKNGFSGFSAASIFIGGFVGSALIGYLFSYTKNAVRASKLLCAPLSGVIFGLVFVCKMSDVEPLIGLLYTLLGFFAIGMYPALLEFAVEATYPHDESVVTAVVFVSSSVQGVGLMYVDDLLATEYVVMPDRTKVQ